MQYRLVRLKSIDLSRFAKGHLWIYSNEIDGKLKRFDVGELVEVRDRKDRLVGVGYINPRTLIACRLLSRQLEPINEKFFLKRIRQAKRLRETLGLMPFCRVVFSEGDFLPGLIADLYGKHLSVQLRTAGLMRFKDELMRVLDQVFAPESILLKNDFAYADYEGLEREVVVIKGKVPDLVEVEENGLRFLADLRTGQKTGFYYDQRANRAFVRSIAAQKTVLDLFCYTGGFAMAAAAGGAKRVVAVDSSSHALEIAAETARRNGFENIEFVQANVFEFLRDSSEQFDLVLSDPPAFIQSKAAFKEGFAHYRRLHQLLMRTVKPNGILVSSSCSHNLFPDKLLELMTVEATKAGFRPVLFYQGAQAPDHPLNPAMPETFYLKTFAMFLQR